MNINKIFHLLGIDTRAEDKYKKNANTEKDSSKDVDSDNSSDEKESSKIKTWFKLVPTFLTIIIITAVIFAMIKPADNKKKDDSTTYGVDGKTVLVTSDDIKKDASTHTSVGSPKVSNASKIDSKSSSGNTLNNTYFKFKVEMPQNFEAYETQEVIYLRDLKTHTQISIIPLNYQMSDPLEVYNQNLNYMMKQTAILLDDNGNECEKRCLMWARGYLSDKTVGSFPLKWSNGTAYYMEEKDSLPIELTTCDYFFIYDGKGVCMQGISQTLKTNEVFALMDQVLNSWSTYEPAVISLECSTFKDDASGISFKYPSNWDVSQNDDGMTIIKAPNSQTEPYAGTVIEYIASKDVVDDYAQYSNSYEAQILLPTFIQEIAPTDFTYETTVNKMDLHSKIKNMDCIYYKVVDKVFPNSKGVTNSLSIAGDTLTSNRWCFKANGYNCMLNIIGTTDEQFIQSITDSFTK